MLEPAMLIGLGLVAVWAYVNHPRLRPGSLMRAVVHVILSFAGFALLPILLRVLIPVLTYVLLSWVWLIARILHDMGGTPRGGHPAAHET